MAATFTRNSWRMRTSVLCLAIVWVVQALPPQAVGKTLKCENSLAIQSHSKAWSTINLPAEFANSTTNYSWATAPDDPRRILLADYGTGVVFGTKDGGCTWSIELRARGLIAQTTGQNPENLDKLTIQDIDVASSTSPDQRYIYVTANGFGSGNGISSVVLVSADDGGSWEMRNTSFGSCFPVCIAIDPNDPAALVSVHRDFCIPLELSPDTDLDVCPPPWHTYLSNDAGATWRSIDDTTFDSDLSDRCVSNVNRVRDFLIDPLKETTIWAINDECLFRSTDLGESWEEVAMPDPPDGFDFYDVDISHRPDAPAAVSLGMTATSGSVYDQPQPVVISKDDGATWVTTFLDPGDAGGITQVATAHGARSDSLFAVLTKQNGESRVFRFEQRINDWIPLSGDGALQTGFGLSPLITSDGGKPKVTVHVRTKGTIERFVLR